MDEQAGGEMVLLKPDMPGGLHGESLNITAAAERPRHPTATNSHADSTPHSRADTTYASAETAHRPAPIIDTPDLSSRSHVMTAHSPDPMSHSRDTPAHTTDQLSRRHVMPIYHPDLTPRRQATPTCAPAPPPRRKEMPHHASAALNRDDSNETTDERAHLETPLRTQLKRSAAVSRSVQNGPRSLTTLRLASLAAPTPPHPHPPGSPRSWAVR
jgi:hypothetical protein